MTSTVINGTPGDDVIYAPSGSGDVEIYAGAGADTILITRYPGNLGTLFVDAGDGDDRIRVESWSQEKTIVHGGAGNDTFYLLGGDSTLYGDAGADVFRLDPSASIGQGFFTIADFSAEDRLNLTDYFAQTTADPFAAGLARFVQAGADALLELKNAAGEWRYIGMLANLDASKLTAAQLGGLTPVVTKSPTWLSMSVAAKTVMEGGKVAVDLALSAPSTEAVTVLIYTSVSPGNDGKSFAVTFQPGQTKLQVMVGVTEDSWTGERAPFYIGAGSSQVGADPRNPPNATVLVTDNDKNGFSVSYSDLNYTYKSLTLLDAVKPGDVGPLSLALSNLGPATPGTRDMVRALEPFVLATTSVALTAYQFFTGKSPGKAGLAFLVNSPDNASDLNDAGGIYAAMNTENRYINFAANLGLVGEGKTAFAAAYKDLAFRQAVEKAYDAVIGNAQAAAAGINVSAVIDSVMAARPYFDALATERMGGFDHDLAMKAGMIGYLIVEGQKAHIGVYARAVENFYMDFMDGSAQHNVDLVAVYGPGTFLDAI